MVQNIFETERPKDKREKRRNSFYFAEVTSVPSSGRSIVARPLGSDERAFGRPISVPMKGDIATPRTGDIIAVLHGEADREVMVGVVYDAEAPDFDHRSRVIGHNRSDSYIELDRRGRVHIVSENGDEIVLGESIKVDTDEFRLNGSEVATIEDVEESTEGADSTATYITKEDEEESLENSTQHKDLEGEDLHDPKDHDHDGDTLTPDTVEAGEQLIPPQEVSKEDISTESRGFFYVEEDQRVILRAENSQ